MRLSAQHVDYMAFLVHKALGTSTRVQVLSPDKVVGIVRGELMANLRAEVELEREAERMLEGKRSEILRGGLDFRKLVQDGARALAKKKGIPL
jgi:hypothetical protein